LRKAAPRSIETLWQTIGQLLDAFAPDECANYLKGTSKNGEFGVNWGCGAIF
jgi:hypothetical protein